MTANNKRRITQMTIGCLFLFLASALLFVMGHEDLSRYLGIAASLILLMTALLPSLWRKEDTP